MRSKCYPIQCFWFSDTFKRRKTHAGVRDVEPFSRFEKPLTKGKRKSRTGECANFLNVKGKNSVQTEKPYEFLEKKADQAFQKELAAQTRYLKRKLNWKRMGNAKC